MLDENSIYGRLSEMKNSIDPSGSKWPENCEGSRKALVIFIGPSPGGDKENRRRQIEVNKITPLWNNSYKKPLEWSRGFRISYEPIVEQIFRKTFDEATKLIARFNLDWLPCPEANDVAYYDMWEGCKYILPVFYECVPDLILPMDEKSFIVLQIALYNDGFKITPARVGNIKIRITEKAKKIRYHDSIMAYKAEKGEKSFIIIKTMQHPARVFTKEYARRIGQSIRLVAEQISRDEIVNLDI